jgi:hypothetical protein
MKKIIICGRGLGYGHNKPCGVRRLLPLDKTVKMQIPLRLRGYYFKIIFEGKL